MKLTLPILIICGSLTVNAQVPETHMALVNPKTATWCSPCGEWGIESTAIMVDENIDKAVFIELHNSDDLSAPDNDEILSNYVLTAYTPAWYVNGIDRTYHDDMGQIPTYTENNVQNDVDSTYDVPPLVNANFTSSLDGKNLTVNTTTKFFQNGDGEYYLAVYIVEDEVDEDQDGAPASYRHDFTLRSGMTEASAYGELISSGAVTAGTEFSHTYTYTLDNEWIESHIWIATVIWQKSGDAYSYINAYTDYSKIAVGIDDKPVSDVSVSVLQNPVNTASQIHINSASGAADGDIALYDLTGNAIMNIYNGQIIAGDMYLPFDASAIPPGIYMIRSNFDGNLFVNKIVVVH